MPPSRLAAQPDRGTRSRRAGRAAAGASLADLLPVRSASLLLLAARSLAAWAGSASREVSGGGRHTALIEINGVIEAGGEVDADTVNEALRQAFKDRQTAAVVHAHQQPGRQPGAGRHHQRRDPAPAQALSGDSALCGGRGDVRLRRLLPGGGRRPDLRRQGEPGRLDRRGDRGLRLHGPDGQGGRRTAPADRRQEQGLPRQLLAAVAGAQGACAVDAQRDPPAVHQGGARRPRSAPEGVAGPVQRPVLDRRAQHRTRPGR